ncbi:MAG TPA: galactose-1-phosphate uridylyltransferase [Ilumatobacteraceae bacterium]
MSQLRLNPLTGRWVTIVSSRAERPTDFAPRDISVDADPSRPCPFCPGNEEATPAALETVDDAGGWRLRIVPNLYPAFEGHECLAVRNLGPVHVQAEASGIHEVFVFSPEHDANLGNLSDGEIGDLMVALRNRFIEHAATPNVRYTQAIVNHGREAGASLSHPHGQLLGMPFVPGEILDEERAFGRFDGGCIICATVEAELVDGARVVLATEEALVVCPYWSGVPYELLIIPRNHEVHLQDASKADLEGVGRALRDAVATLNRVHGDIAFNLVVHTAPHQHGGPFHWHLHLWPNLITVAGFERGTGVLINIVPPEKAAEALRRVAVVTSS